LIYPLTGEDENRTRTYFYHIGRVCGECALQLISAALST
jgi:hypothetical protein